jgi:hypothetical protein
MGRPDMQGSTVIDNAGGGAGATAGDDLGGGNDGFEAEGNPPADDSLNEPGDGTDPNGAGEPGAAPEDAGPAGEETPGAGEGAESGPLNVEELKASLREELLADLQKDREEREAAAAASKPVELTEEQWIQKEAQLGVPRNAIQHFTGQMVHVYNKLRGEFEGRLAKYEKRDALQALAADPKFRDAGRYQKDVDEFLSQYEPRHWTNGDLLKQAVLYARGKNVNAVNQNRRALLERNKRIGGAARPGAAGSPGAGPRPAARPLTTIERSAARAAGMSDEQYSNLKKGPRTFA